MKIYLDMFSKKIIIPLLALTIIVIGAVFLLVSNIQDKPAISSIDLSDDVLEFRYNSLITRTEKYEKLMFKCETIRDATQFNDLMMEINTLDAKYNLEYAMLNFDIDLESEHETYNEVKKAIKKADYIDNAIDECLDRKALQIWK